MKMNIQAITSRIMCGMIFLLTFLAPIQIHAAVTGDLKSDPIILEEKQTKNTCFTKDGNVKYFRLIVKETGTATISFSTNKLKKNAIISLYYDEGGVYKDQTTAKYTKKSKMVKGSLTSSRLLMPGQYNIVINTEKVTKDTKFTIKTTFKKYDCDDIEPNNKEETAQSISIKSKKNAKKYNMLLSGETNSLDMIDYFSFDLKSSKKIAIRASAQGTDNIRVLIKKKTDNGTELINSKENEQYFVSEKGKNSFVYKSAKALSKGTYYVMIWLDDSQKIQVPYTVQTYTF